MPGEFAQRLLVYPLLLVAGCLLGAGSSRAQQPLPSLPASGADQPQIATATVQDPPVCPGLTLEDLERLALSANPTLPAAEGLVVQQEGLLKQAGSIPTQR